MTTNDPEIRNVQSEARQYGRKIGLVDPTCFLSPLEGRGWIIRCIAYAANEDPEMIMAEQKLSLSHAVAAKDLKVFCIVCMELLASIGKTIH